MTAPSRLIPLPRWLREYRRTDLSADLGAGFTVAIMLIPQAMAYAMLAGLPPIVGLYAAVFPVLAYALIGGSRQLAVGPVAMDSLLTAAALGALVQQGTDSYLTYAILLSLLVGVIQIGMSALRMGFVVNFLSHPVLTGFTAAAALIIGLNQLNHLLGVAVPRSQQLHRVLIELARRLPETQPATLAIGVGAVISLWALKRWRRSFPAPLLVVALATLITWAFGLDERGVRVIGAVPAGLPRPSLPAWDGDAAVDLLASAATLAVIGFVEAFSIAKGYARKYNYELDANRELGALGAANLSSAIFGSFPVTGGFSRSAVNDLGGARTPLAGVITALIVAFALLWLTPLLFHMPRAVLAAIILTAVGGLIDLAEVRYLWRVKRRDLAILIITFVATLGWGIVQGISLGVVASILLFVVQRTRPHLAVLGRLPESRIFRNVENFPDAKEQAGILAVRLDAAFYFGNIAFVKERLAALELPRQGLRAVVLDASAINDLDSSAAHALADMLDAYEQRGLRLLLSGVKQPVREVLRRSGLEQRLGSANLPIDVAEAVDRLAIPAHPSTASHEQRVPARSVLTRSTSGGLNPSDKEPR